MAVPPHLLRGIASAQSNPLNVRQNAQNSFRVTEGMLAKRASGRQGFIPNYMLRHIAESKHVADDSRSGARRTHELTDRLLRGRSFRFPTPVPGPAASKPDPGPTPKSAPAVSAAGADEGRNINRAVYDAKNTENEQDLPGDVVRVEGQSEVEDAAVNQAFDNVGKVLQMYKDKFGWASIDNKNMHVTSSVHFGKKYENAFWDPERMQMVFGDGGEFLNNFTGTIDVIGHELTHAVTEHTSPLDYHGMSGALNEHVSDVFGIMVKQIDENEKSSEADWLIGEGCIMPGVKGVALRSMKEPGTAYDDPRFGKDPQPSHFRDYVPTFEDNGGVHIYSGIPNKAFYLASVGLGGFSYEKAGPIWWRTMSSGRVPASCNFLQFADITVEVAEELYGADAGKTVREAWDEVGVTKDGNN
ncbi:Protease PrtS [Colletotrichum trifolii]|uniref:Protease PrtS n=1 Tax=Colletotrichum trifolii TaxID=5466 RepID=A0A4R8QGT5_COLTR|nr:Protease PrtS [Colletotrichum trifolii]